MDDIFEGPIPLSLPPLFQEQAITGPADPFAKACALAATGCDSGLLVHNVTPDILHAAIIFAPEVPLEQAMAVMCVCGLGFQNALGALAPPEVAVHLTWPGDIIINGANAGRMRVAASTTNPTQEPNWLVVGLEVQLLPRSVQDPGLAPDQTSLFEEGCGDVSNIRLLESWVRHTMVWLNDLDMDEKTSLHEEWRALVREIGEDISVEHNGNPLKGKFLGIDENFGMLFRSKEKTTIFPLSSILEKALSA